MQRVVINKVMESINANLLKCDMHIAEYSFHDLTLQMQTSSFLLFLLLNELL